MRDGVQMTTRSAGGKLDVIIPAYNAQLTIARAVKSAFDAGAKNVFVVNDGSNDDTADIARQAGAQIISQENQGAAAARRKGANYIHQEYVVLLDADDALLEEGVRESIQLLEQNLDASAAYGPSLGVKSDGSIETIRTWDVPVTFTELMKRGYAPAPPCAIVWRTRALKTALFAGVPGHWPRFAEDYELLIRCSMTGLILSHSRSTSSYALAGGKSMANPVASLEASELIRAHYASQLNLPYRKRSRAKIRARAWLRVAKSLPGHTFTPRRLALQAGALIVDPQLTLTLVFQLVRRALK
jgi:glycosyltransferase involved in cell wall biosynthesis